MTIDATLYERPDGKQKMIKVSAINPDDEKYILDNKVKVSLEEAGAFNVVYFDDGKTIDNEPDEIMVFGKPDTPKEKTFAEGVRLLKERNGMQRG